MNSIQGELERELGRLRAQNLWRALRCVDSPQGIRISVHGRTLTNFSSNDYLGLANDPALKEAAIRAIERYGVGTGASRLICGSLAPFHELETKLAAFKKTEAALAFASGYAAALGTICSLVGPSDVVILDKWVHASIVDAARLSGAKLRVFPHNDLADLEEILQWARRRDDQTGSRRGRILIVTESVFSMDGDSAPLRDLVLLKEQYGAWLMVDEAHATGILGPHGAGLADELALGDRIEVQMGTLGKALGTAGGFICGSRQLIDLLINRARSFIFSTAPTPAAAAAAAVAIEIVQSKAGEDRRRVLHCRVRQLQLRLNAGIGSGETNCRAAIVPWMIGPEARAVVVARRLCDQGYYVPAVRYPTVRRGQARLRFTLSALHQEEDIEGLARALSEAAADS